MFDHESSANIGLDETAAAIRETTAKFAREKIQPLAAEIDRIGIA